MSKKDIIEIDRAIRKIRGIPREKRTEKTTTVKEKYDNFNSIFIKSQKELLLEEEIIVSRKVRISERTELFKEKTEKNEVDEKEKIHIFEKKSYTEISDFVASYENKYIKSAKYESGNPTIIEASEYILGKGIMGVAFIYKNIIMVLDKFYGKLKDKILDHEKRHLKRPDESEMVVRRHTDTLYTGEFSGYLG